MNIIRMNGGPGVGVGDSEGSKQGHLDSHLPR